MKEGQSGRPDRGAHLEQLVLPLLVTCISVAVVIGSLLLSQLDTPSEAAPPTEYVIQPSIVTPFLPTFTPVPAPTGTPTEPEPTREVDQPSPIPPTPEPTSTPIPPATVTPAPTEPPAPPPTPHCGPPAGWVTYIVQPNNTLYSLARHFGVTTGTLQRANCMSDYAIRVGQELHVPPEVPTPMVRQYPAPVLVSPDDDARFATGEMVTVHWTWDGELGPDEYFDVRLWQEGAPNYGVGWSREGTYGVAGEPNVIYYWSIAVIRGRDGQMLEQLSPQSPPRRLSWGSVD